MRALVTVPARLAGVLATLLVTLLAATVLLAPVAAAEPGPPAPAPGPAAVEDPDDAGSLVARIATARTALDALSADLGQSQELANRALADEAAAGVRADEARRVAQESRRGADVAAADAERARTEVDAWVAAWFQQADVLGPLSVLSGAAGPDDVAERAHLRDVVTADRRAALERAEHARIEAANADSRARAARIVADAEAVRAADARTAAEAELARVRAEADAQQAQLAQLTAERDDAEARLRALEDADPELAAQRDRAAAFDAAATERDAARDLRVRDAARAGLARRDPARTETGTEGGAGGEDPLAAAGIATDGMSATVEQVVARALSQLGVVYAWGGGDADGPTQGIRDGGEADAHGDYDKTGFDCSGLMIYAFAAAGKELPHYSGYQAEAGRQVPLAEREPGDLLFWADDDGAGAVHHVALYLGDDRMVEAPESGKTVRITPVRINAEILPTVTRLV